MTFLRFLRLLSLALWIGGIFFFAAVVAPTLFAVLPTRFLAGQVVSHSLFKLHWLGFLCAIVYIVAGVLLATIRGTSAFQPRELLLAVMIAITLFLHYGYEPKMVRLRDGMGIIDNVPHDDPRRVEFNRMHVWSSRLEGSVLFLGLGLFYLVVREQESKPRLY